MQMSQNVHFPINIIWCLIAVRHSSCIGDFSWYVIHAPIPLQGFRSLFWIHKTALRYCLIHNYRDDIGQVTSSVWFPPGMTLVIQSSIFVSFVSHGLRVLQVGTFWQRLAVMCLLLRFGFCLATLPCRSDWQSAVEMVVYLEGSPLSI